MQCFHGTGADFARHSGHFPYPRAYSFTLLNPHSNLMNCCWNIPKPAFKTPVATETTSSGDSLCLKQNKYMHKLTDCVTGPGRKTRSAFSFPDKIISTSFQPSHQEGGKEQRRLTFFFFLSFFSAIEPQKRKGLLRSQENETKDCLCASPLGRACVYSQPV